MGCFWYECAECGVNYDDVELDTPVMFVVQKKNKKGGVVLRGTYDGYGRIYTGKESSPDTLLFYPIEFKEHFDYWGETYDGKTVYVCDHVYCEKCMDNYSASSLTEWSANEFQTVKELLEPKKEVAAPAVTQKPLGIPPTATLPAAATAPAPKQKKAPKVPKLKKAEMDVVLKEKDETILTLQAEIEKLKVFEQKFKELERLYQSSQEDVIHYRKAMRKMREAIDDVGF